jgi:hypothetical protein
LLDAVRRSGWFAVRMERLAPGDYLVNGEVLVERKTIRNLVASLVDGRLLLGGPSPGGPIHHLAQEDQTRG